MSGFPVPLLSPQFDSLLAANLLECLLASYCWQCQQLGLTLTQFLQYGNGGHAQDVMLQSWVGSNYFCKSTCLLFTSCGWLLMYQQSSFSEISQHISKWGNNGVCQVVTCYVTSREWGPIYFGYQYWESQVTAKMSHCLLATDDWHCQHLDFQELFNTY